MAFWGVEVKPGKPVTHSCEEGGGRLRISQATLGFGEGSRKTILQCNVGNRSPVLLGALLPNNTESCGLDLEFEEADDVVFSVIGPRSVYLSGYYIRRDYHSNPPRSDTESYGVDIENSQTDGSSYGSDEDTYQGSFINDDDDDEVVQDSLQSPVSSSQGMGDVAPDNDKLIDRKGRGKQLKKKHRVVESDNDAISLGSEDEDFSLSAFMSKRAIKTTISDAGERIPQLTLEMHDEAKDDGACGIELNLNADLGGKLESASRPLFDEEKTEVNSEKKELPKEVETLENVIVSDEDMIHGDNTMDAKINQNSPVFHVKDQMQSIHLETKQPSDEDETEVDNEKNELTLEKMIASDQDMIPGNISKDTMINQNLLVGNEKDQMQSLDLETKQSLDEEKTVVDSEKNQLTLEKIIASDQDMVPGSNSKDTIINQNLPVGNEKDQKQFLDLVTKQSLDEEKTEVDSVKNEVTLEKIIASYQDMIPGNNSKDAIINQNLPVCNEKDQMQSLVLDTRQPLVEEKSEVDSEKTELTLEKIVAPDQDMIPGNSSKGIIINQNLPVGNENDLKQSLDLEMETKHPLDEGRTDDTTINQNLPLSNGEDLTKSPDLGKPKKKRKKGSLKEEKTSKVQTENEGDCVLREEKEHEIDASTNLGIGEKDLATLAELGSINGQKSKKRRKKFNLEGTLAEGIGEEFQNVPKGDIFQQNLLHGDNQEQQIDNKISIKCELLANDNQLEKKTKKKKKKTRSKRDLQTKHEDQSVEVPVEKRTFSSGLIIEELGSGESDGKVAAPGKKVKIYYTGMLKGSGQVFESNVGRAAFKFRLGDDRYIDGWKDGIDGMHVGDKRRLTIPPSLGYGDVQVENVPPNSWLVYEIEVVGLY